MTKKRVVVAMSGGVDSSMALAVLKDQGYDCVGVSMQLWDYSKKEEATGATGGSCCSLDDIRDARGVADSLGLPFYVVNVEEAFSKEVVDYFVKGYLTGQTPNPCVKCNQVLKFEVLLKKAVGLEADYLATGHYARIEETAEGFRLLKGADPEKDQSYFLFTMTQEQLSRVLFPVGGMTKKEVRAKARELGLKTSEKKESQEICFVEEPSYTDFLSSRVVKKTGEIISADGRVLGTHTGLFNYTVGQRKGLGLSGGPFYVLDMDLPSNRLIVGPEGLLYSKGLVAGEINWINAKAGKGAKRGLRADSKIRYRHRGAASTVTLLDDGGVRVVFSEPQKSVTPGQAVVFYDGDEVLGGGWIKGALKD
ncbi:MAG: tRNA 2-thiouridine(34) synthase MnmA [Deltaproteobacteria bacterium]|nr:tRNA 2-thiouridine(34) synthase MnmA [Deltaproteobacteria bacterium]